MQVDVNAYQANPPSNPRPSTHETPTRCGIGFYRRLCQRNTRCYRCLKAFDGSHRGPDGRTFSCTNPGASSAEMDAFVLECQNAAPRSSQPISAVSSQAPTAPAPNRVQRSTMNNPRLGVPRSTSQLSFHPSASHQPLPRTNIGFDQAPPQLRGMLSAFPPSADVASQGHVASSSGQPAHHVHDVSAIIFVFSTFVWLCGQRSSFDRACFGD
ncbi:uncharacterized protein MELLADRAFT_111575 [Melampsora larici-populina 98AG31]|uniref:Uncharacterized protein n=1 Tax=Melampsora larici-populina (strain 98AG31 / pathotype 3-4-7) TaxID=747676 RepID=F4S3M9_MELLP|nr:uncharacterized protein MELLADRAFT_111575 [Melampsora larici-populina 98AG31]EGG00701.1 hypothetical protein MELLADRAFT_111575 [Melampsora larici-populina 98AG31]